MYTQYMFKFDFSIEESDTESSINKNISEIQNKSQNKQNILKKNNFLLEKDLKYNTTIAKEVAEDAKINNHEFTPGQDQLNIITTKLNNITSISDVVPNIYEGGFKIWECCYDSIYILDLILNNNNNNNNMPSSINIKNINIWKKTSIELNKIIKNSICLDLGCGHGYTGLYLGQYPINFITFQDFNKDVLSKYTIINTMLQYGTTTVLSPIIELKLKQNKTIHEYFSNIEKLSFIHDTIDCDYCKSIINILNKLIIIFQYEDKDIYISNKNTKNYWENLPIHTISNEILDEYEIKLQIIYIYNILCKDNIPKINISLESIKKLYNKYMDNNNNYIQDQQEIKKFNTKFIYGDWKQFTLQESLKDCVPNSSHTYDIIVSTETLYNQEMIPYIINILKNVLNPKHGIALFFSKRQYFGVGGSTFEFQRMIKESNILESFILCSFNDISTIRDVIVVKYIQEITTT